MPRQSEPKPKPPAYLTSPGLALAQRSSWETRYRREMTDVLTAHVQSMTAGAFPGWGRAVSLVQAALNLPLSFVQRIFVAQPSDSETPEQVADRMAPTLATQAYNTHVLHLLAEHGFPTKQWLSRRDPKTRRSHLDADGQRRALSAPFVVGGFPLQYPGDSRTAPIEVWVNCRCVIVAEQSRLTRAGQ